MRNVLQHFIILILLGFTSHDVKAQECDSIFHKPEKEAQFKNYNRDLLIYANEKIVPLVSKCNERDSEILSSLHAVLTIDFTGKVIEVSFREEMLSEQCQSEIKLELLNMVGWTPAMINSHSVCSYYYFTIGCIKWE